MTRTSLKYRPLLRQAIFCLLQALCLVSAAMLFAEEENLAPTANRYAETPGEILPGTFNPDGNFSNVQILSDEPVSTSTTPDSPGDLLDQSRGATAASRELTQGSSDPVLPGSDSGGMTPSVSRPLGEGLERLIGSEPGGIPGTEIVGRPDSGVQYASTRGSEFEGQEVADVQIVGNSRNSTEKIMQLISTRTGRPFRSTVLDDDIRRMSQSRLFVLVEPYIQRKDKGVVVLFNVRERAIMKYLKFQGNEKIRVATLEKECGLVVGKPVSAYDVEEGRKKLELFYQSKGYAKAVIKTVQGDKNTDPGVIYQINEGPRFRVAWTNFIGNTIVSGGRLKTVVQSKPGILWVFGGELRDETLTDDVRKLEDYYRRLGFFYARISRRVQRTSEDGWCGVTFVINEGPQAKIRQIRYIGNAQFDESLLLEDMKVHQDKPFNKDRLDQSIARVRRRYGKEGYVFADITAEARVLDDPSQCDVVFAIKEGKTYRVGRVNVLIEGDFPHTQVSTVLNRLSVKPGDLVNVNELQQSERRLRASQLFAMDPQNGQAPKIVYTAPELAKEAEVAQQIGNQANVPNASDKGGKPKTVTTAGQAAVSGNGAGRAAIYGQGSIQKVYKKTVAEVDADFQLGENEELIDLTIYGVWNDGAAPKPAECVSVENPEEIIDPETGEAYRTFEIPEETDVDLQGRVSVCNDDPAYQDMPVRVTTRPTRRLVNYENGDGSVPLQPIPGYTTAKRTDESPATTSVATETNAPAWASEQTAESEPPAQIANVNPRTGQEMSPPPQPGISNPDLTPYSQHLGDPPFPGRTLGDSQRYSLPITVQTEETTTGRLMFSLGVSSDSGLVGSVVVDEQNFDWRRWPRSWSEIKNGTAWRGRGQHFRMEATPGTEVQRYAISFDEPYLFNSEIGLGTSLSYYDRIYKNWDENRQGGQIALSRALTHDMRAYLGFRGFNVRLTDPDYPIPDRLYNALGNSQLFGFSFRLVQDRRDSSFLATEGYYASLEFEQVIGTWSYPRFNAQFKKYWLLFERADMSGRHVLSFTSTFSWTGDDTPIYESYFAGGTTTIRGFEYRGASPRQYGMVVGGNVMVLASLEYLFPITADDSIRGVLFCDTGTVESDIRHWNAKYRVSLGAGLRISMPMLGSAPIALDFAVPVSKEDGDEKELFSFTMGLQR
ncbi:MAG: BamA/TamA family outer membrane protein [Planctomycetia bacterium]|nr:BamA/TamA family outer membrane protein [Planctomycetia bacterium]